MRIITQISLFDDTQNENLEDLEWLQKILDCLPDEKLVEKLKSIRGRGRNEWPVEASIAGLPRELNRNSQLRLVCGFQPHPYSILTKKKDEHGKKIRKEGWKLAPHSQCLHQLP